MKITLTPQGIPHLFTSPPKVSQPLFQLLQLVKQNGEILHCVISDGHLSCIAILNPAIPQKFQDLLKNNVILHVLSFGIINKYERTIIINDLYIAMDEADIIGDPNPLAKLLEDMPQIVPINTLNKESTNWSILARVLAKTTLRKGNKKSTGEFIQFFYFDILDKDYGLIKVSCFDKEALKFYPYIEIEKVFTISRGRLVQPNKQYNKLPHRFEIHANNTTVIHPAEDDGSIRKSWFAFKDITQISSLSHDTIVDFLGLSVNVSQEINLTGASTRCVTLEDCNGRTIKLTMNGSICQREGQNLENSRMLPVVVLGSVRVEFFGGITSLSTIANSEFLIDPNIKETEAVNGYRNRRIALMNPQVNPRTSTSTSADESSSDSYIHIYD